METSGILVALIHYYSLHSFIHFRNFVAFCNLNLVFCFICAFLKLYVYLFIYLLFLGN